jgi:hypothetical protein
MFKFDNEDFEEINRSEDFPQYYFYTLITGSTDAISRLAKLLRTIYPSNTIK